MNMGNYTSKLNQLRKDKGLTFEDLAFKLNIPKSTLVSKFNSDNTSKVIDLLSELDIILIDRNGIDIITGEKAFPETEKNAGSIQIGNVLFDKNDLDKLKNLLDNIDND
jgi:transcriptional regulator with XRE-family HTH domain